jgi:EAL domain-containing protein (putative c-di-GMP-specific phosphodiesterase class I)
MHAKATAALSLQTDLQNAVDRGEFELAFQPIVDPQHRLIKGFEALIRWRHPVRGIVSPAEFVPLAEEIGLIRQIDRWVLDGACAQLARWRRAFPDAGLHVAVNMSATEFDDPGFLPQLEATLAAHALPPAALELEITETIFLNPDPRIAEAIAAIRRLGVRVGLDDFGTGYSSLSYLNRYPTDTIKIDKSFVDGLCSDDRTLAIVLLIIQLAGTLGVDVVAEGVETEEQAELLASMNCSHAQGYYFARPLAAAEATAMMSRSLRLSDLVDAR